MPGARTRNDAWLPGRRGELFLRAALLSDPGPSWSALRAGGLDLDTVSNEEHRLLPLVHRNLRLHAIDDPDLARMKGVRRRAWASNQRLVRRVAELVQRLQAVGIEPMALKGLALAVGYLADLGLRPMADADLLVAPRTEAAAAAVLIDAGLAPQPGRRRPYHTAWAFTDGETEIDLHWRLHIGMVPPVGSTRPTRRSIEQLPEGELADEWRHAEPLALAGVTLRQPDPTSLLLHTCVHGAGLASGARLRWASDAWVILDRRGDEVAWERLARRAAETQTGPLLADALDWLAEHLSAPVPHDARAALRRQRPNRRAALATRWRLEPPRVPALGGFPATVGKYLTLTAAHPVRRAAGGFPDYLADEWQIGGLGDLAPLARSKVRQRLAAITDRDQARR